MKWRADLLGVHSHVEAPYQHWHSYIPSWLVSFWHMIIRKNPLISKSLQREVIWRQWLHCHTANPIIFIHYLLAGGSEPFRPLSSKHLATALIWLIDRWLGETLTLKPQFELSVSSAISRNEEVHNLHFAASIITL